MFGPNGGRARCFALVSISFNIGLMLGPFVIGLLFENVGYYYMNIILGRSWNSSIFHMRRSNSRYSRCCLHRGGGGDVYILLNEDLYWIMDWN